MTFKDAIAEILPKEEPSSSAKEKRPRIRTPNLTQAVMLPFYKVPKQDNGVTPTW